MRTPAPRLRALGVPAVGRSGLRASAAVLVLAGSRSGRRRIRVSGLLDGLGVVLSPAGGERVPLLVRFPFGLWSWGGSTAGMLSARGGSTAGMLRARVRGIDRLPLGRPSRGIRPGPPAVRHLLGRPLFPRRRLGGRRPLFHLGGVVSAVSASRDGDAKRQHGQGDQPPPSPAAKERGPGGCPTLLRIVRVTQSSPGYQTTRKNSSSVNPSSGPSGSTSKTCTSSSVPTGHSNRDSSPAPGMTTLA